MVITLKNPYNYDIEVVSPDFPEMESRLTPGGTYHFSVNVPVDVQPFIKPLVRDGKTSGVYIAIVDKDF